MSVRIFSAEAYCRSSPRCEGYGFVERHFFAISIDYNEQVFGVERYFSPFLVAGGRAYTLSLIHI